MTWEPVAGLIASFALALLLIFLVPFASAYWIPLIRAKRELSRGSGAAAFIYQRLRSHPDEFKLERFGVYGEYVVHQTEDVAVSLHTSYNQSSILVDYNRDGIGTFLHLDYDVGAALAGRVREWSARNR